MTPSADLTRLVLAGAVLSAPSRAIYSGRWTPTLATGTSIPIHVPALRRSLDDAETHGWIVAADCGGRTTWTLTDGGRRVLGVPAAPSTV